MAKKSTSSAETRAIEAAAAAYATCIYTLVLYITGATARSARAISNIRKICDDYLEGRYELKIVDITCNPALAEGAQIIAAPTLIKTWPLPVRRFIGDMSQTERILHGLDFRETTETSRGSSG